MQFDRLCAIAERVYKSEPLKRLLKQARIFDFPGRIHEVAKDVTWDALGGSEFLIDHFFLPFPVIAIEDTASCVVIADDVPGQNGLNVKRTFIECMDLSTPFEEFGHSMRDPEQVKRERADQLQGRTGTPGSCLVTISQIEQCRAMTAAELANRPRGTGLRFGGACDILFVATKDEMLVAPHSAKFAMKVTESNAHESALINAVAALEEVMHFNSPDRFVVERSADTTRKPGAKGLPEIRRSPERPHYIMLRPDEIRTRLGIKDEVVHDRRSPTPHARRRHYRTLRSDRFTNKAGQVVIVKASWVGPTEGEFKGRHYKVMLDL